MNARVSLKYFVSYCRSRYLKGHSKFYENTTISVNIPNYDEMLYFSKLTAETSRFDQENYVTLNDLHNCFKSSSVETALIPEILIADESTAI